MITPMESAKKQNIQNSRIDLSQMSASQAAKTLLGFELVRQFPRGVARVRIVETEAYDQSDAASHSYNGQTQRTEVMFGEAGHLYVYFTYGMHYCCNIVVGPKGYGAAVLIRAVEPISGDSFMLQNRQGKDGVELSNGPAKLCQALQIDKTLNGHNLQRNPLKLIDNTPLSDDQIITTTRIGISKAIDEPWRFYVNGNPYVSSR